MVCRPAPDSFGGDSLGRVISGALVLERYLSRATALSFRIRGQLLRLAEQAAATMVLWTLRLWWATVKALHIEADCLRHRGGAHGDGGSALQ